MSDIEKHLWLYDTGFFSPTRTAFDHMRSEEEGPYNSWKDFMTAGPFNCNCLCGEPILWWFWRIKGNYLGNDRILDSDIHDYGDDEYTTYDRDIVTLIYGAWDMKNLVQMQIAVKAEDEKEVHAFLKKHGLKAMWDI